LKDWTAEELATALEERELMPVLARQIVHMSKIAWVKHRMLQASLTGAVISSLLVVTAAELNK
jgi:hypothetical protein